MVNIYTLLACHALCTCTRRRPNKRPASKIRRNRLKCFVIGGRCDRLHPRSTRWRCGRWRPDLARGRDERTGVIVVCECSSMSLACGHANLNSGITTARNNNNMSAVQTQMHPWRPGLPSSRASECDAQGFCMSEAVTSSFFLVAVLISHSTQWAS